MTTSTATLPQPAPVAPDLSAIALEELIRGVRGIGPRPSGRSGQDAITIEGLRKTYPDGTQAVQGISFSVAAGEAFGMLGPNGAGKSTTIGVLSTLVRPTAGKIEVAAVDVVDDPNEVRRRIGFASQEVGTDDFATPVEFLVLQGRLHGMTKQEAGARARLLLSIMGLESVAARRLGTLSGGTKRRVDLAASLVHLPPILFLDEPTEGLDPRSRAGVWDTLTELRRELGTTLVLTTHSMEEAERLCDRLALIDRGKLVAEGTPEALKATVGDQALVIDLGDECGVGDAARAERAIGSHEEIRRILVADRHVSVFGDDSAALAPKVLHTLELAGLTPRSISITKPTLEDVYLHYTGRALDQPESTPESSGADLEGAA